jgi:hypothetical protein
MEGNSSRRPRTSSVIQLWESLAAVVMGRQARWGRFPALRLDLQHLAFDGPHHTAMQASAENGNLLLTVYKSRASVL